MDFAKYIWLVSLKGQNKNDCDRFNIFAGSFSELQ